MTPMRRLDPAAGAAFVLLMLAGCSTSGSSPVSSSPPGSSLEVPSLQPPPPSASVAVISSLEASPAASLGEPPGARIATGVTFGVDGVIGAWRLDGAAHEQAWIDLAALKRTDFPAKELVFAGFDDGTPIGAWSIRVAPVSDATGADAVDSGSGSGNGADFVTIGRIDAGTWILELTLTRADGRGEATYYWEILAE
jgi:hypothetical protein